ncbi:MAG: type IV pilus secretin PilQ [Proteobacteria bacterium]|nr:type IV pilus secretin PilQ [Pseudomonadota bacterium]
MLYTISKFLKNGAQALLVALALVLIVTGCTATKKGGVTASDSATNGDRTINSISVSDEAGALKVNIQGNSPLRYTSVKQAFPLGIVLYFPGTKLENIDSEYPPEGTILSAIKTSQQSHSAGYDSRIKVLLNSDVDYDIIREENGLIVNLTKPAGEGSESVSVGEAAQGDMDGVSGQEDFVINESGIVSEEPVTLEEGIQAVEEPMEEYPLETEMDTQAVNDTGMVEEPDAIAENAVEITDDSFAADSEGGVEMVEPVAAVPDVSFGQEGDAALATQIISIDKIITDDSADIHIDADGKIEDYKIFTIPGTDQKSGRIVCDVYKIKGINTKGEQKILVNSNGIQTVRYFNSPDKMRVVIDATDNNILNAYTVDSGTRGLIIHIGAASVASDASEQGVSALDNAPAEDVYYDNESSMGTEEVITEETTEAMADDVPAVDEMHNDSLDVSSKGTSEPTMGEDAEVVEDIQEAAPVVDQNPPSIDSETAGAVYVNTDSGDIEDDTMGGQDVTDMSEPSVAPAAGMSWVNQIDFTSEKAGKSAIIIGTTHQVEYKVSKKDDRTIHFRLYGTKLPKTRKYPFITTRFESAVNRIIPVQTPAMGDNSLFIIELREAVPYYVDQQGSTIKINFEASSVPPQPEDMAGLPLWKEVLSKTPEIKDIEMEFAHQKDVITEPSDAEITSMDDTGVTSDTGSGAEMKMSEGEETSTVTSPVETPEEPMVADTEDLARESEGLVAPPAKTMPVAPIEPIEDGEGLNSMMGDGGFVSWSQKKKYTGEKISVDFFETDIKNVFRIIRAVSSQNFAIDKDVDGKVTMTLDKPVPWDQVLDLVLKMNMLGMVTEGGINRIATLETLKQEEQKRLEYIAAEEQTKLKKKSLEPIFTEYILINYSNAEKEILPHIEKLMTADRGKISVDKRTNQIILTDTKEKIKQAKELIQKLDKITPQVIIEARIVEATTTFSRSLGTEWNFNSNPNFDVYNDTLGGTYGYQVAMNNKVAADSSIGINFTRLTGAQFLLNAKLLAMESKGEGKIISAPKVLTIDNKEATIIQGVEIPFATYSSEGTKTMFKKIELKLSVTPHVTADNKISLKVLIDKNDVGGLTDLGPTITTKKVESELLINDGDTIVIGGIIKSNKNVTEEGFPFISKLPVIGWLFKSKIRSEDKQELLVFLSPRVVSYEDTAR